MNYGGDALPGDGDAAGLCGKPLIQRFPRHTGKLYWHIVAAQPDYILSVNTTSAWPQPPWKMVDFFHPDLLRLNHYIDALGARASPEAFKHKDASKVLDWGANLISAARKGDFSMVPLGICTGCLFSSFFKQVCLIFFRCLFSDEVCCLPMFEHNLATCLLPFFQLMTHVRHLWAQGQPL